MKPKRLEMSAFGSYGGIEIIDFEKVNRGVFLITGDTGAGKTTIFDAITYALFDQTSGGKRDGDMMRSQYADEKALTYVELTFLYGEKTYKVRRNPNYRRVSKRRSKEGELLYTMESSSVELTMPDGQVFQGRKRETNEKIQEILGITVNQFTQISMIAQGEFLKLLHAPSKERKEIFGRIFDTGVYEQMQVRLKEQSRELKNRLDDNKSFCEHELLSVRYLPESAYEGQWEEARQKQETGLEDILGILDEIIAEIKEETEALQEEEKKNQALLDEVKLELKQVRETNRLFEQEEEEREKIRQLGLQIEEQLSREAEWKKKQAAAEEEYRNRLPELEQSIATWKDLIPKYGILKQRREEMEKAGKLGKKISREQKEAEKKYLLTETKIEELEKRREQLSEEITLLPQWRQKEKDCEQEQAALTDMCKKIKELKSQEVKLSRQKEELNRALAVSREKSLDYEEKNRVFIKEQAGILATALEDGQPCPVCGSTHHPDKAKLSKEAVTQGQVEAAKKGREQAEAYLEERQKEFQKKKEACEALVSVLVHEGNKLFGDAFTYDMPAPALKEKKQSLAVAKQKREELEQKQTLYEKQKLEREQLTKQKNGLLQKKETLTKHLYEAELNADTLQHTVKELLESLPFEQESMLQQQLDKALKEREQLEQQQKNMREALQGLQQSLAKAEGTLQEKKENHEKLKQRLDGKSRVDTGQLTEKEHQYRKEHKTLEDRRMKLAVLESRNCQAKENLENMHREKIKLIKEYQLVDGLARVANGNLRQQARMDLQTYVQRYYFRQIIDEANKRLRRMSGERFMLQCRNMENLGRQGEVGLDLDVLDLVNNKTRDVKSLSGGESFLAALSMALGMSDIIQYAAGRVRLNTMFIDEGFGSLDDEARSRAIWILHELAGETRLVGIISHVTELKEEMDRKLLVTKSDSGSQVQWVLES